MIFLWLFKPRSKFLAKRKDANIKVKENLEWNSIYNEDADFSRLKPKIMIESCSPGMLHYSLN